MFVVDKARAFADANGKQLMVLVSYPMHWVGQACRGEARDDQPFIDHLTANDFLRSTSVIAYSDEAMRRVASNVQLMADKEGLSAHRASIDIRLK